MLALSSNVSTQTYHNPCGGVLVQIPVNGGRTDQFAAWLNSLIPGDAVQQSRRTQAPLPPDLAIRREWLGWLIFLPIPLEPMLQDNE